MILIKLTFNIKCSKITKLMYIPIICIQKLQYINII